MTQRVWLIDLQGQAELPEGTSDVDGLIVRPADRTVLGIGIKTGFLTKRTKWASLANLLRADGSRTWLTTATSQLEQRPPDGVWLRPDLNVREGTEQIGTVGWAGIADGIVVEIGIIPTDPRAPARRVKAEHILALNDRSIVLQDSSFADAPLLKTDRDLEDEIRRRLWETDGSLPPDVLERLSVSVTGGIVTLSGMVPKDAHRDLAVSIAHEPLEVRGVTNHIESGEALSASARREGPH